MSLRFAANYHSDEVVEVKYECVREILPVSWSPLNWTVSELFVAKNEHLLKSYAIIWNLSGKYQLCPLYRALDQRLSIQV